MGQYHPMKVFMAHLPRYKSWSLIRRDIKIFSSSIFWLDGSNSLRRVIARNCDHCKASTKLLLSCWLGWFLHSKNWIVSSTSELVLLHCLSLICVPTVFKLRQEMNKSRYGRQPIQYFVMDIPVHLSNKYVGISLGPLYQWHKELHV